MKINYNDLLMMLWNLSPNAACFAKFDQWDKNEDKLIKLAQRMHKKVIIVQQETNNYKYVISNHGMEIKANACGVDLVGWHDFKQEYDYGLIKQNLNIQHAYVFENNLDLAKIQAAFGDGNVTVVTYDQQLNHAIKQSGMLLEKGEVEAYDTLNGFNYAFKGFVEQGNQLGRTIGYPTANIVINHDLVLKPGVYITKVKLPNIAESLQGISAYWTNHNEVDVFETHIFDFDQDIYGWGIEVELIAFIRDSKPAANMQEVKALLDQDKAYAQAYFKGNIISWKNQS